MTWKGNKNYSQKPISINLFCDNARQEHCCQELSTNLKMIHIFSTKTGECASSIPIKTACHWLQVAWCTRFVSLWIFSQKNCNRVVRRSTMFYKIKIAKSFNGMLFIDKNKTSTSDDCCSVIFTLLLVKSRTYFVTACISIQLNENRIQIEIAMFWQENKHRINYENVWKNKASYINFTWWKIIKLYIFFHLKLNL